MIQIQPLCNYIITIDYFSTKLSQAFNCLVKYMQKNLLKWDNQICIILNPDHIFWIMMDQNLENFLRHILKDSPIIQILRYTYDKLKIRFWFSIFYIEKWYTKSNIKKEDPYLYVAILGPI